MFPELAGRFRQVEPGEEIDLGGTSFEVVEAIVKPSATTTTRATVE